MLSFYASLMDTEDRRGRFEKLYRENRGRMLSAAASKGENELLEVEMNHTHALPPAPPAVEWPPAAVCAPAGSRRVRWLFSITPVLIFVLTFTVAATMYRQLYPAHYGVSLPGAVSASSQPVTAWAEAFCARDGQALLDLYDPEARDDFYRLEYVWSLPGETPVIGLPDGPWPEGGRCSAVTEGDRTVITYWAEKDEPHLWAWTQVVRWREENGTYYGRQESFSRNECVISAAQYEEIYGKTVSGTPMDYRTNQEGLWRGLEILAGENEIFQRILTDPALSLEYLLNLFGGEGTVIEDPDGRVTVCYRFSDGSQISQAMFRTANGIWLPGG